MRNYIDYNTFESHVKNLDANCFKLDINYNMADHRCWSAVVNPGQENIIVTFTMNKDRYGTYFFDIITQDRTSMDVYAVDIYDILGDLLHKNPVAAEFNFEQNL